VIHRMAWSRVTGIPDRCPAYIALGGLLVESRWMPPGSSEWMIGRPPACWLSAAFCWIPSIASSLNPHQSAHTETEVPSLASRSAILLRLYRVVNERILKPNSWARSIICAISSARVAVVLHVDVAAQHFGQRLRPEVPLGRIALVILVPGVPLCAEYDSAWMNAAR